MKKIESGGVCGYGIKGENGRVWEVGKGRNERMEKGGKWEKTEKDRRKRKRGKWEIGKDKFF